VDPFIGSSFHFYSAPEIIVVGYAFSSQANASSTSPSGIILDSIRRGSLLHRNHTAGARDPSIMKLVDRRNRSEASQTILSSSDSFVPF